jgi:hypothetical protein
MFMVAVSVVKPNAKQNDVKHSAVAEKPKNRKI